MPFMSTTVNNTEDDRKDENYQKDGDDLDERTTSVEPNVSDKVASNCKQND